MKPMIVHIPSLSLDLNLEAVATVEACFVKPDPAVPDAPYTIDAAAIHVIGSADVLMIRGPEAVAFLAIWRDHTHSARIDNLLERHADTLARAKANADLATARAKAEAESRAADEKRRAGDAAARPGVGQIGFSAAAVRR